MSDMFLEPKSMDGISQDSAKLQIALGQWYWVTETCKWNDKPKGLKPGDKYEWLGCIMQIGSNFVELHTPHAPNDGYDDARVHFDKFWDLLPG